MKLMEAALDLIELQSQYHFIQWNNDIQRSVYLSRTIQSSGPRQSHCKIRDILYSPDTSKVN